MAIASPSYFVLCCFKYVCKCVSANLIYEVASNVDGSNTRVTNARGKVSIL